MNRQGNISEENKKWIDDAVNAGIHICLASGRYYQNIFQYVEELKLDAPIIAVNGGEVWIKPGLLLNRHFISGDGMARLRQIALKHDVWYAGVTVEGRFTKEDWPTAQGQLGKGLKFVCRTDDEAILLRIAEEIGSWGEFEITSSNPRNLELNPKGVSKASGLREICSNLGIEMKEVVSVGDGLNDLDMIESAGLGVAMRNAAEEVKKRADVVTSTNQEDGVAEVLKGILRQEL